MSSKIIASSKKEEGLSMSLLDLPESNLEYILERLSPAELCTMSEVCTSLRDRCRSDCLWEKLLMQKWSRIIGYVAHREWKWHMETRKREDLLIQYNQNGSLGSITGIWPSLYLGSYLEDSRQLSNSISDHHSVLAWYISLESGRFWFPGQVYTRGGLVLCCYDVLLSFDSKTDTFRARYRHDGGRKAEENIPWDRVRASPVEIPPNVLHCSDCLNDLKPRDHIEVQWRRGKDLPYDWWYATIGHLGSCDESESHCHCRNSDMLMLEFKQYSPDSIYRRVVLNRNDHGEQVMGGGGYYGGIRKLHSEDEIARWKQLLDNSNYGRPIALHFY
ncbi:F-box protein [Quillaja saponaria]|nr:F-box protein [Quillaja saponaria]